MPDPEGRLTTPVGINSDGLPRAWTALWGYSERYVEEVTEDNPDDGHAYLLTTAVPEGYVYHIEYAGAWFNGGSIDRLITYSCVGVTCYRLTHNDAPSVFEVYRFPVPLTLKEGDKLRVFLGDCLGVTTIELTVWGWKMEL